MWLISHWLSELSLVFYHNSLPHHTEQPKIPLNSTYPATRERRSLQNTHIVKVCLLKCLKLCLLFIFFKSTCKANVIRCCSFYERGEIILNTDTQWVYLFRNLLNRVWEFKYSMLTLYRTGQEPEPSLQRDPLDKEFRPFSPPTWAK